jgi:hypothetical protein
MRPPAVRGEELSGYHKHGAIRQQPAKPGAARPAPDLGRQVALIPVRQSVLDLSAHGQPPLGEDCLSIPYNVARKLICAKKNQDLQKNQNRVPLRGEVKPKFKMQRVIQ